MIPGYNSTDVLVAGSTGVHPVCLLDVFIEKRNFNDIMHLQNMSYHEAHKPKTGTDLHVYCKVASTLHSRCSCENKSNFFFLRLWPCLSSLERKGRSFLAVFTPFIIIPIHIKSGGRIIVL